MAARLIVVVLALLPSQFLPVAALAAASCKMEGLAQFPVTMQGTRPMIAAKINGTDVKFVVDSGTAFSVLSPASAEALNLPRGIAPPDFLVSGASGVSQPMIARVSEFGLGGTVVNNMEFLVAGSSMGEAVGILGQNVLAFADIEYDLAGGYLRMLRAENCKDSARVYWVKPGEPFSSVSIKPIDKFDSHIVGAAYLNGKKIRVIFDSGAAESLLSLHAAQRAGVKTTSPGVTPHYPLRGGAGLQLIQSWIAPFKSFRIGNEEITNTRIRIADIDLKEADMLLGADFFMSHRIYVAWGMNKVLFTRRAGAVFDLGARSSESVSAAGEAMADAGEVHDAQGYSRRSSLYAARGDMPRALADISQAINLAPQEAEYYHLRSKLYAQAGQGQLAMADLDKALGLNGDYVEARLARAQLQLNHLRASGSSNMHLVIADADAATALAAPEADLHFDLGILYAAVGTQDKALASFEQWLKLHRDDSRAADAAAFACRARGVLGRDLTRALPDCNRAVQDRPGIPFPLEARGLVHLRLKNFERAMNDLDKVIAEQPGNAWALYTRGLARLGAGRTKEGESDIGAAKSISPREVSSAVAAGLVP